MVEQLNQFEVDTQAALDAFQKGDPQGMRRLLNCVGPRLLGFLTRLLGNQADAEDVLQETFAIILKKGNQQNLKRGSAAGWIFTIAKHEACHLLRSRNVHTQMTDSTGGSKDTALAAEHRLTLEKLQKALNVLPLDLKIPLLMREFLDLTYSEIAQLTESNVNQVAQAIYRARTQLRNLLEE